MEKFGLPIPRGEVAFSVEEVCAAAERLGGRVVVKAQIHAGGRGKAGGVKIADDVEVAARAAKELLGTTLVTNQTGPNGRMVRRLLVEERLDIKHELYLSVVIDRILGSPVVMASAAGGIEIEKVAADTPNLILRECIEPNFGFLPFQARRLAYGLGLDGTLIRKASSVMVAAYDAFYSLDASVLEINPLVITNSGDVLVLDAKISLDANALFRHSEFHSLRDLTEEDELEVEASKYDLNYIRLDGNIGCMVNGAGLAMATMDIVKLAGGEPANFLDVGGGAKVDKIRNAFRILVSDTNVQAVFINIFGGILRCDVLAQGVISAVTDLNVTLPVVIRMEGTNVQQGQTMLAESGLNFSAAKTMASGAEQVVALAARST